MFADPSKTIREMKIEPGMVVVDFGAGSGHYTIESARRVANTGKVYAVDFQQPLLEIIRKKAVDLDFKNVFTITADLEKKESTRLGNGVADIVITSNVLFQVQDKKALLKEAFRILKEGGRVAVIEWQDSYKGPGPSEAYRLSKDQVYNLFMEEGFKKAVDFDAGSSHYGVIFLKPING